MSSPRKNGKSKRRNSNTPEWMLHDTYAPGVSTNRIVTRSQTAFLRIRNTPSDLELFADPSRHQPPGKPHLMEVLKGQYGSVPRTIVTRSTGKYIDVDEELIKLVNSYK